MIRTRKRHRQAPSTLRRSNLREISLWKPIKWFSVQTTPVECKNTTNTGHFGFVFEENLVREIT